MAGKMPYRSPIWPDHQDSSNLTISQISSPALKDNSSDWAKSQQKKRRNRVILLWMHSYLSRLNLQATKSYKAIAVILLVGWRSASVSNVEPVSELISLTWFAGKIPDRVPMHPNHQDSSNLLILTIVSPAWKLSSSLWALKSDEKLDPA